MLKESFAFWWRFYGLFPTKLYIGRFQKIINKIQLVIYLKLNHFEHDYCFPAQDHRILSPKTEISTLFIINQVAKENFFSLAAWNLCIFDWGHFVDYRRSKYYTSTLLPKHVLKLFCRHFYSTGIEIFKQIWFQTKDQIFWYCLRQIPFIRTLYKGPRKIDKILPLL